MWQKNKFNSIAYLEFIGYILLVEGVKSDKLEALGDHVEGFVHGLGAHCHRVGTNLQGQGGAHSNARGLFSKLFS